MCFFITPFICRTKDKCDQISPLDLIDRADIETLTHLDGGPIVIGEGENGTTYLRSYQGNVVLEKMLTNKRGKIIRNHYPSGIEPLLHFVQHSYMPNVHKFRISHYY